MRVCHGNEVAGVNDYFLGYLLLFLLFFYFNFYFQCQKSA